MASQPQSAHPAFRFENWLSARSCRSTRVLRGRPCVVHPLLALALLMVVALAVTLFVRLGVMDTLRTWTRLAAPTTSVYKQIARR